ncbi:methyltransferase [uncultured Maricaulis sp.]|uniref:tRNA1(Val) (adenine(37)-N6)-methyltransferase n=1 Tax=uncultured Maricaulis sp. TaxID=174710 RepID=UPI0030D7F089|tara:strand:+ start:71018 stop:71755 length:738 start_codon:yes stop_codon:yes gene_type:complete
MSETTLDGLLDGRVQLRQSAHGYRAGMDAVLLAASLAAKPGELLVEFGCGPGAALLCAAQRMPTCSYLGIEIDPQAVELATGNIAANRLGERVRVRQGDIAKPLGPLKAAQVFFNPPYFDDPTALRLPKAEKQRAWLAGDARLPDWIGAAVRVLEPKGRLTLIHRADALGDILAALASRFGSVAIRPVHPRAERPAKRVLVTARLGGKAPLVILPPLLLHDDGEAAHTAEADAILRGQAMIAMDV